MKSFVLKASALVLFSAVSCANAADGTLTVTGTIASSISLTIESTDTGLSGVGTAAATSGLGATSKFGSAPAGFTLARGASDWTLSSTAPVGVKVVKANSASTNYTLTALLGQAPAYGVAWKLANNTLSESTATELTTSGTYAIIGTYAWDIVVADTATAAAFDNSIVFTATAN